MFDQQDTPTDTPTFSHHATVYGYDNNAILAAVAAQRLVTLMMESQNNVCNLNQPFHLLLTGGSDTLRMLRMLADNPLLPAINWSNVHIWWADERFVPCDSKDRNARQARALCLDVVTSHKALAESHIHEMPADDRSAEEIACATDTENDAILAEAASDYEQEIVDALGNEPVFDLAILGMGPDAHMASLFPGLSQIDDRAHIVLGVNHSPKQPPMRLTLTVPVLAHVRRAWFLTAGAEKGVALMNALSGENDSQYPASFAKGSEETAWLTTAETLRAAIQ